jgi:hypothetical protein
MPLRKIWKRALHGNESAKMLSAVGGEMVGDTQ